MVNADGVDAQVVAHTLAYQSFQFPVTGINATDA